MKDKKLELKRFKKQKTVKYNICEGTYKQLVSWPENHQVAF